MNRDEILTIVGCLFMIVAGFFIGWNCRNKHNAKQSNNLRCEQHDIYFEIYVERELVFITDRDSRFDGWEFTDNKTGSNIIIKKIKTKGE